MADRGDGLPRARRKSLVDIGRAMGVLASAESLPRGFDTPISPPPEELHLSPRSHDGSPRSSHSSMETSSVSSTPSHPESMSRRSGTSDSIPVVSKIRLDRISEDSSLELDDGPSIKLNGDPYAQTQRSYGSRTSLEIDSISSTRQTVSSSNIATPSAHTSIPRGEHHRSPSEIPTVSSRYSHLPATTPYSSTTPNPRTSSSPLSGAFSFFSKIFNTTQDLPPPTPSSSAPGRTTLKDAIASSSTGGSHSTPSSNSRLSDDFPRASSDSQPGKSFTTRPSTLPPKTEQEEIRHRELYLQMVHAFEAKEAQLRQENERKQKAKDERIMQARIVWTREIVPHWDKKKRTKALYELVLQGIPASVRTKVWPMLLGNDLHITPELFKIYVKQAEAGKALRATGLVMEGVGKLETASLIGVDLPRTFPALAFYQEGGPNHAELHRVLDAYVCYRPDIGYVQGMSYLAAILLLYLDDSAAFSCLANLLNRSVQMAFYKMDVDMQQYISLFETLFKRTLPELFSHFESIGLTSDMYLLDWILTIFSKSLPLDLSTRLWDIYIYEGQSFFFRASLGILKYTQSNILANDLDLGPCKRILARLPEDNFDEDALMASIASVTLKEHEELMNQFQIPLFKL